MTALGLSAYTEIIGCLYCGNLKKDLGKHYISFIQNFFHADYIAVSKRLENDGFKPPGLYSVVRSGLTHEYFIKIVSKIEINNLQGQSLTCGVTYDPNSNPQIVFYVNQYFTDFKNAFEQYYDQLNKDSTGLMLRNFESALHSINSSLIGRLSKNFREDVSGKSF